jgi:hypothetical protein
MDKLKLRVQINDQLDTIIAQASALRANDVTNRSAAVALLASNVETLVAWEKTRATLESAELGQYLDDVHERWHG